MRELVYLIGEPGSGKSTALAALTRPHLALPCRKPFAHIVYAGPGWEVTELGGKRDAFSGTDVLALNAQPLVLDWLANVKPDPLLRGLNVVAEGDRLANGKFFSGVLAAGWNLTVIRFVVTAEVAAARRVARAAALGVPPQNEAWIRGRITKVARLAADWPTVDIDAAQPPDAVAAALAAVEAPPLRLLASNQ